MADLISFRKLSTLMLMRISNVFSLVIKLLGSIMLVKRLLLVEPTITLILEELVSMRKSIINLLSYQLLLLFHQILVILEVKISRFLVLASVQLQRIILFLSMVMIVR